MVTFTLHWLAFALAAEALVVPAADSPGTVGRRSFTIDIGKSKGSTNIWAGWVHGDDPCHLLSPTDADNHQWFSFEKRELGNPCHQEFSVGGITYTWEGCGGPTWLNRDGKYVGPCTWGGESIACKRFLGLLGFNSIYHCNVNV